MYVPESCWPMKSSRIFTKNSPFNILNEKFSCVVKDGYHRYRDCADHWSVHFESTITLVVVKSEWYRVR